MRLSAADMEGPFKVDETFSKEVFIPVLFNTVDLPKDTELKRLAWNWDADNANNASPSKKARKA